MTDGVRRNFLGSDYQSLLDALQRELTPPSTNNALADFLGRTGPLGPARPSGGLGGIFGLAGALAPPPQRNALADIFGTHPLPTIPAPSPSPTPTRRKVFFSFHYDDVCRTVQVRNAWRFRRGWSQPSDNFYDKSLWEKSRTENEEHLKRIIRRAMAGSTVTCVLAGSETWDRPYVRFEIAHSLFIKNGLFTVFIHDVRHPQKGTSWPGHNPLACMGLLLREDGKGRVVELVGSCWQYFELMKMPVPWPQWLSKPSVGRLYPLSHGATGYDYVRDNGYENLPQWAQAAADAAGRR
jgi:hypothetical protein